MIKNIIFNIILLPSKIYNFCLLHIRHVKYGKNLEIRGSIEIHRSGKIFIGDDVTINSCRMANPLGDKTVFEIGAEGEIVLGNRVGISGSTIKAYSKVTIEDDVMIGAGCIIMDTDSHSIYYDRRISETDDASDYTRPILIKRGAFIGAKVLVTKGVIIGEKSVIAAGSVVCKDVPDNELWGGTPAHFIKKINNIYSE